MKAAPPSSAPAPWRGALGEVKRRLPRRRMTLLGLLEHGEVEAFLAAEVVIDHPLAGVPRAGRDRIDPRAAVALEGRTPASPLRRCCAWCLRGRSPAGAARSSRAGALAFIPAGAWPG